MFLLFTKAKAGFPECKLYLSTKNTLAEMDLLEVNGWIHDRGVVGSNPIR